MYDKGVKRCMMTGGEREREGGREGGSEGAREEEDRRGIASKRAE